MPFAQEKMGFDRPPKLFLRQDQQNADNPLGKTGFYDPEKESITLYTTNRHPKDIMRSLAHELQHHTQKCNGEFDNIQNMGEEGYAQADPHMRTMEIQAYQASIVFRDWEDSTKGTIYYEHLQKGDNVSMSTKKWKNGELKSLLSEAWGFKMDLSKLNEEETHKKVLNENNENIFAPNHYCVHHGGVHYNGSIQMAEAIRHNYNEKLGRVTHYDMKLADGTILENVAAEDIQTTNATLAEKHKSPGKRDAKKGKYDDGDGKDEKCDHVPCKDKDQIEEYATGEKTAKDRDEDRTGSGVGHGSGDDDSGVGRRESEGEEDSQRELDEGEGDRGDKDREQGRDAGREHRADSSGKGVSEAQVRRIIAKVLKERRKKGK